MKIENKTGNILIAESEQIAALVECQNGTEEPKGCNIQVPELRQ